MIELKIKGQNIGRSLIKKGNDVVAIVLNVVVDNVLHYSLNTLCLDKIFKIPNKHTVKCLVNKGTGGAGLNDIPYYNDFKISGNGKLNTINGEKYIVLESLSIELPEERPRRSSVASMMEDFIIPDNLMTDDRRRREREHVEEVERQYRTVLDRAQAVLERQTAYMSGVEPSTRYINPRDMEIYFSNQPADWSTNLSGGNT